MKKILSIIFFAIIANTLFGLCPNKFSIELKKHSKNKIEFVLQNISNDTLLIEQFYCEYKRNQFIVKNYMLSNDTLMINWNSSKDEINSPYKINYHIDGEKIKSPFKVLPNAKLRISVKLSKDDFPNAKFICVQLNQTDKLNIKL